MSKISIITVCYNSAKTIRHTIESVLAQSHPSIEYIVVDGASSDNTLKILEEYKDRIDKIVSEPDKGIYDAMNKGIRLSTGDIVGTLNSDDIFADSDVLYRATKAMDAEGLDAVYGDVAFFRSDKDHDTVRRYSSRKFSPTRLASGWMPAHPTLLLRRRVFDKYGLYRTDFRIAGDYEFVARIFKDDELEYRYLPEIMVRMRIGGVSTNSLRSTWTINREILRACKENGISTSPLKLLSKYPAKMLEFFTK